MTTDTKGVKFIRGLVKTVFIICYIAFMWASIHHVATYFNNFEAGNGDWLGSYALAGAFDVTALVTTIGVMFFRKSMPTWVLWIVWIFILAIAGYSFFINWEYASHYQNMDLILQPTGETTPVYDAAGQLHYVPVMRANTNLLWINPVLASGFTIFSLIYSIIAEFFGAKPPTTEELLAKKAYLEETSDLLSEIAALEGRDKKTSWVQRAKEVAKEVKDGAQELAGERKEKKDPQALMLAKVVEFYRATPHLLMEEQHAQSSELIIKDMLKLRKVEQARAWRIQAAEVLRQEQVKVEGTPALPSPQNHVEVEPETEDLTPDMLNGTMPVKLQLSLDFLRNNPSGTDEELAEILELNHPASARFWRLKAMMNLEDEQNNLSSQESKIDHPEMELEENNPSCEQGTHIVESIPAEQDVIEATIESESSPVDGRDTDPEMEVIDEENFRQEEPADVQKSSIVHTSTMRFTRRKPLTVLEVAEVLGCSERHVRNLRSDGKLLPDEADKKNLITAASVKTYLENRTRKTKVS
jgi:hypothetical protein